MSRVLTPGGFRDSAQVHRIPNGQKLCFDRDHYVLRDRHSGTPAQAVIPGALAPAAAANIGWKAFVSWTNDSGLPIRSMAAAITVPNIPNDVADQTIFLFPGIQNMLGNVGILQPVLQFGPSALGGGPMWSVASWYVPMTGEAFHSNDLVPVAPGAKLVGRMTLTAASGGLFSYVSQFDDVAGTECYIEGINELTWCNLTLESYQITSPAQYPQGGPTFFEDVKVSASPGLVAIPWSTAPPSALGETAIVVNNGVGAGQIEIKY